MAETKKRRRPSAKETRARMARAASTATPISRADDPERDEANVGGGIADVQEERREERRGGRRQATVREEKLVRLSVDVPRAQHKFLRMEAAQAETTGMAVVRALISEMETDGDLAKRVRDRLTSA